jgi:UDP-galactose transporter B1
MDNGKVQVLTAGGAATPQTNSSQKKKKRRKKKKPTKKETNSNEAPDLLASDIPTAAEDSAIPGASLTPNPTESQTTNMTLEFEHSNSNNSLEESADLRKDSPEIPSYEDPLSSVDANDPLKFPLDTVQIEDFYQQPKKNDLFWLFLCFIGIMFSFVCYGLLLEYTTSGGRKLHELSFLFVTSGLYTLTAAAGRYVRAETPSTIPPARFAILGLTR